MVCFKKMVLITYQLKVFLERDSMKKKRKNYGKVKNNENYN